MNKRVGQWISVISISFITTACGYYHKVTQQPSRGGFKGDETLGFEVVKTIFSRNRCLDCHAVDKGNRGGINLETYASTKVLADSVVQSVASGFMPIGGPPVSAPDQAVLKAWVDAGAPEVSDLPLPIAEVPAPNEPPEPDEPPVPTEPPVPNEPPPVDFELVRASIFTPHCIGCHSNFADYSRVVGRLPDIQRSIDTNFMPMGSAPLSTELKQMLADWIANGAPEASGG